MTIKTVTSTTSLNLALLLKISPQRVIKFLSVPLGQKVKKGDVIAVKKGTLGLRTRKIVSPVSGVLEKLEANTGKLTIKKTDLDQKVVASDVSPKGKTIKGILGFGEAEGELIFKKEVDMGDLDKSIKDKIILCPEISSIGAFFKASALGARGLTVGMMSKDFFDKLEEATKGRSRMALLVIDTKETKKELFGKIKKLVGKEIALSEIQIFVR